jgi:signal transduction histidine kinase
MPTQATTVPDAVSDRRRFLADTRARLTVRSLLFVGFGSILLLWIVSGVDLVGRLIDANQRTTAINARLTRADDLVSAIRSEVLLASVGLRDALLDSPDNASFYRDQLTKHRTAVTQALKQYEPIADSIGEREALNDLQSRLEDFWQTRLAVINWNDRRSDDVLLFIHGASLPTPQEVIRVSAGVQELHRASFLRQQQDLTGIYDAMRHRVWITGALVLVLSVGVALLVTVYAGRLERRIREQRVVDLAKTEALQRLSARLVHAQEEERRAIARELHDEVGQAFTAIKLELSVAERTLGQRPGMMQSLDDVRAIADRALQSIRDLSHLLHPALLDDIGLLPALELQLQQFSRRTGVRTDLLQDRMDERFASETELCLYRVAQEALTNIARHAEASSCRIYLERMSGTVVMTVEDDGKGFPALGGGGNLEERGLGLLGIGERVTDLNGRFRVDSAPGRGTRLTVELPAEPRVDAADAGGGLATLTPAEENS